MPYTAPVKTTALEHHIKHPKPISPSPPESPKLLHTPTERLHLSGSYSADHVRRHRRSPSLSKSFVVPVFEGSPKLNHALNAHAAVRWPSPTLGNTMVPPGAVISPPESNSNSSDEEQSYQQQEAIKLEYLEAAVRSIEQKRESSTERKQFREPQFDKMPDAAVSKSSMKPGHIANDSSSLPLSKEGRKLSHSRTYTMSATVQKQEEAISSSPEDSGREDEPKQRPPMIRKKSGELVRPALRPSMAKRRPSSMPGTPTFSKAVHFDSQLEHIRHFVQLDRPLAVSAETSPVEDYDSKEEFPFRHCEHEVDWELRLSDFPQNNSRPFKKVQLERLTISSENTTLVGLVAVANLAYHKHVVARFTFDYWKTVSEVVAEYDHDIHRKYTYDGYDRFSFSVKLDDQANLENKTMFTSIRYNVNGQELWDNNNGRNYQADFIKTTKPKSEKRSSPTSGSRQTLPRSKSFTSSTGRSLSMPRSIDDFSEFIGRRLSVETPESNGDVKPLSDNVNDDTETTAPIRRGRSTRQAFSTRYDFEASLSAAIRDSPTQDRTTLTAQAKSVDRSIDEKQNSGKRGKGFTVEKAVPISQLSRQVAQSEYSQPSSLIHEKMHQDSSVYKELVDKYCFYGSSKDTTSLKQMASEGAAMNGLQDTPSKSPTISPISSPVLSPHRSSNSRSCSREPRTSSASGSSSRTASSSPISLGYSYHQSLQNNFLKETHTPAVIRS